MGGAITNTLSKNNELQLKYPFLYCSQAKLWLFAFRSLRNVYLQKGENCLG